MFLNILDYIDKREYILYKIGLKCGPISLIKKLLEICRYRRDKLKKNIKLSFLLNKQEKEMIVFYLKSLEELKYEDEEDISSYCYSNNI